LIPNADCSDKVASSAATSVVIIPDSIWNLRIRRGDHDFVRFFVLSLRVFKGAVYKS
jgi:hypothetical protein